MTETFYIYGRSHKTSLFMTLEAMGDSTETLNIHSAFLFVIWLIGNWVMDKLVCVCVCVSSDCGVGGMFIIFIRTYPYGLGGGGGGLGGRGVWICM